MSGYTGQVPDTEPAADWRAEGVCRRPQYKGHADLWFAAAIRQALATADARTLRTIWEERTYLLPGGHLGWRGKASVDYGGRPYTKKQIAYFVSRGRMPYGCVRRMCEVEECVLPAHIADQTERQAMKVAAKRAEANA